MSGMLRGERNRRRRAVLGLTLLFALVDTALALAVLAPPGTEASPAATPMHPAASLFTPDGTQVSQCTDDACFRQAFGNVAFREGPKAALDLVEEVYGEGGSPACHAVVHTVGAGALTRNGGDVARTFAEGSSICWSGYYHGIIERALLDAGGASTRAFRSVARTICSVALETMTPWIAYQCLHGLGHGVMIATGIHLERSLAICKSTETRWERDACKGGVFMENISPSFGVSHWLREDDLIYPCNAVALEDRTRCYQMVTTRVLPAVGNDWDEAATVCAGVETNFVQMCFRSLGRDASSNSGRDVETTIESCIAARPYGGEASCIRAAAQDVTANFTNGARARPLCERVAPELASACFEGIGSVMGRFRKATSARVSDCRSITADPALVDACRRGGLSTLPRR
ncbi:MAG: hypothetical protein ACRDPX_10570 [Gaiellaceae bacterium]